MRFSAVVALCAAPLALAGTLQADLIARGAGHEDGASVESSFTESQGTKDSKSQSNGNNRNGGGNLVVESTSITEVIIIWVNNGGGAPTSTVQAQSTIAGAAAPPGSQATHTVSSVSIHRSTCNTDNLAGRCWWIRRLGLLARYYRGGHW
jgi:hypothetical protein